MSSPIQLSKVVGPRPAKLQKSKETKTARVLGIYFHCGSDIIIFDYRARADWARMSSNGEATRQGFRPRLLRLPIMYDARARGWLPFVVRVINTIVLRTVV